MKSFNNLEEGCLYYKAVSINEPIAKPLPECNKIHIFLHLYQKNDKKLLKSKGVALLRRQRLVCLSREAFKQGALLTQEDLALLLCTSPSTIKRDTINLTKEGVIFPTRGYMKGIGRGISFKSQIIKLYKKGCPISEIGTKMMQPIDIIEKCIIEYKKVINLNNNKIPLKNIHIITSLSIKTIKEYLKILNSQA